MPHVKEFLKSIVLSEIVRRSEQGDEMTRFVLSKTWDVLSKGTGTSASVRTSELSPFCWVLCPGALSITLACHAVGVTEMLCGCSDVHGVLPVFRAMITSVCSSFVV